MERFVTGVKLAGLILACALSSGAQGIPQADSKTTSAIPRDDLLRVPAGETLLLELQDSLNTRRTRKGDRIQFSTTNEVLVGERVAIGRGSSVRAMVIDAKRPGRVHGHGEIQFRFDELVLGDGSTLPISATLLHPGPGQAGGKSGGVLKGEGGKGGTVSTIIAGGAQGAIFGAVFGGLKGAARGGAAGAAIGALRVMLARGPELDLPRGMLFEIELDAAVNVPVAPPEKSARLGASATTPSFPTATGTSQSPNRTSRQEEGSQPVPDFNKAEPSEKAPAEQNSVAANRPTIPPPTNTQSPAGRDVPNPGDFNGYRIRSDVNLVLVDATVRNHSGQIIDNLKQEDFRMFEDGKEQKIRHFSRDELPLAVALVVDRSGSVAPYLSELRDAAYKTLFQLKPGDQVALFTFAHKVDRLEDLTTDRQRIAGRIAGIEAGGGTNIIDAIYMAARYLRLAAPNRRRAIILVSDNEGNVRGFAGEHQAIEMALEADAAIYSVKVRGFNPPMAILMPLRMPGTGSVRKMTRETGGEIIDAAREGSLEQGLAAAIARLKMRYTLGYPMPNGVREGAFRRIDVRLAERFGHAGSDYTIHARRGYYAAAGQLAARNDRHAAAADE